MELNERETHVPTRNSMYLVKSLERFDLIHAGPSIGLARLVELSCVYLDKKT